MSASVVTMFQGSEGSGLHGAEFANASSGTKMGILQGTAFLVATPYFMLVVRHSRPGLARFLFSLPLFLFNSAAFLSFGFGSELMLRGSVMFAFGWIANFKARPHTHLCGVAFAIAACAWYGTLRTGTGTASLL